MEPTATPQEIAAAYLEQVSVATGVKVETLLGPSQDCTANKARQTAIVLLYQLTRIGISNLGALFRRDHTAVYYAINRAAARSRTDPGYARHLRQLLGKREILRPMPEPVHRDRKPKLVTEEDCVATLSPATHGRLHELRGSAIEAKLTDARDQLAYWTLKKGSATTTGDRAQASARILIWTGEVAACERRLRELVRTEALTA